MIRILIPIICGLMYRWGGSDQWLWCPLNQKLWRKFIGIFLSLIFVWKNPWAIGCIPLYLWLPDCFPYGEDEWIDFLGDYGKFFMNGFAFGVASLPLIGWWAIPQAITAGFLWMLIKYLDDKDIIKNPWVEFLRGVGGTVWLSMFL